MHDFVDSRALAESVFAGTGAVFKQLLACYSYRLTTLLHQHDVQNRMKSQANLAYTRKQLMVVTTRCQISLPKTVPVGSGYLGRMHLLSLLQRPRNGGV